MFESLSSEAEQMLQEDSPPRLGLGIPSTVREIPSIPTCEVGVS